MVRLKWLSGTKRSKRVITWSGTGFEWQPRRRTKNGSSSNKECEFFDFFRSRETVDTMWTVAHREALCNLCAVTLLVGEKSAEETRKSHVILVADDVARGFQCVPARHVCSAPSGTFATDGSSSVRSSERPHGSDGCKASGSREKMMRCMSADMFYENAFALGGLCLIVVRTFTYTLYSTTSTTPPSYLPTYLPLPAQRPAPPPHRPTYLPSYPGRPRGCRPTYLPRVRCVTRAT